MSYIKTIIVITIIFLIVGIIVDTFFLVIKGGILSETLAKIPMLKYLTKNITQAIIMGIIFTFLIKRK